MTRIKASILLIFILGLLYPPVPANASGYGPYLVKDLLPGPNPTIPNTSREGLTYKGQYIFVRTINNEPLLWRTDGTEPGTRMILKLSDGWAPGIIYELNLFGNINDRVIFQVISSLSKTVYSAHFDAQWNLVDLQVLDQSFYIRLPINYIWLATTEHLIYYLDGTVGAPIFMRTDGTPQGTFELVENSQTYNFLDSLAVELVPGGTPSGKVVFSGLQTIGGVLTRQYWLTDGSKANTHLFFSVPSYTSASCHDYIHQPFDGRVIFSACLNGLPNRLLATDGTAAGTALINGPDGTPASSPEATDYHGAPTAAAYYFNGVANGMGGLWKIPAGTNQAEKVRDFPLMYGFSPSNLVGLMPFNERVVFITDDGTGNTFWISDGTAVGTHRLCAACDFNPGGAEAVVGNSFFFLASTAAEGYELWGTDGTDSGTKLVADINPGPASSVPRLFFVAGSILYFSASDPVHGEELWAYKPQQLSLPLLGR